MASDWKKVLKAAKEQGWVEQEVKKGARLVPPDPNKDMVVIHKTPSDVRAIRNTIAEMRRQGFVWPWPPGKGNR